MTTVATGFEIKSGMLACSDPCYDSPSVLEPAQNGNWIALVQKRNEGVLWGIGVSKIIVYHQDSNINTAYDVEEHTIDVDSGQAGVFDSESYGGGNDDHFYDCCCKATLGKVGYDYVPKGFVTSSGFGDGCYPCRIHKLHGKAVRVEITFIGDEEDDEDD